VANLSVLVGYEFIVSITVGMVFGQDLQRFLRLVMSNQVSWRFGDEYQIDQDDQWRKDLKETRCSPSPFGRSPVQRTKTEPGCGDRANIVIAIEARRDDGPQSWMRYLYLWSDELSINPTTETYLMEESNSLTSYRRCQSSREGTHDRY
jgi:hypothetical protein